MSTLSSSEDDFEVFDCKECKSCGVNQPMENYWKSSKHTDGHLKVCKNCKGVRNPRGEYKATSTRKLEIKYEELELMYKTLKYKYEKSTDCKKIEDEYKALIKENSDLKKKNEELTSNSRDYYIESENKQTKLLKRIEELTDWGIISANVLKECPDLNVPESKVCNSCQIDQSIINYTEDHRHKDNRSPMCKGCKGIKNTKDDYKSELTRSLEKRCNIISALYEASKEEYEELRHNYQVHYEKLKINYQDYYNKLKTKYKLLKAQSINNCNILQEYISTLE